MFGASVMLSGEIEERRRLFFHEFAADQSAAKIWRGLDALGLGSWVLSSTGGGCYAYELELSNGYLLVTDSEGPISRIGDADDFLSGAVMVGFYGDSSWDADGVYVGAPMVRGVSREVAIVEAVRRVLDQCFTTAEGISWGSLAHMVQCWATGDDYERAVEWINENRGTVEASWRVEAAAFLEALGSDAAEYLERGETALHESGALTGPAYGAVLESRYWWFLEGCSDQGDTLAMLALAFSDRLAS